MDQDYIDSLRAAGAPEETIATVIKQHQPSQDFEVLEENWPSFILFIELKTQWTVIAAPMGGFFYTGIPRPCIESEMNLQLIPRKKRPALHRDLRIMESAALEVLNKRKES